MATCFSWHKALTQYMLLLKPFEIMKRLLASLFHIRNSPFRQIYSLLWILLRGKGRNKHIFTFPHLGGEGMHIKLKGITKSILICISIRDESVKAELKKRDRHWEFTQKAPFVETPSLVRGENEALECVLAWQRRDERASDSSHWDLLLLCLILSSGRLAAWEQRSEPRPWSGH